MILSKEISQFSLPNEILYLLLQTKTLVCVMAVIFMEAAILVFIVLIRIFLYLLWPLKGWVILDLYKHLIKWNV